jgi:hypothetical protein
MKKIKNMPIVYNFLLKIFKDFFFYPYIILIDNNKYGSDLLVFKNIYKLSISAVEIRRLYCTYLKYEVKNGHMTEEQHREIAEMMNHSYEENLKYSYEII